MQGHQQSEDDEHDELEFQLNLYNWVWDRMVVDEVNIQVMDGCRNNNGKLFNNYSYGTYLQVAVMVHRLKKL